MNDFSLNNMDRWGRRKEEIQTSQKVGILLMGGGSKYGG
jgi:hypothetical protein